jgi:hypothetical protein
VFITTAMSGSGQHGKYLSSLAFFVRAQNIFLKWWHQKQPTCKHVSIGILFPSSDFLIFGTIY